MGTGRIERKNSFVCIGTNMETKMNTRGKLQ